MAPGKRALRPSFGLIRGIIAAGSAGHEGPASRLPSHIPLPGTIREDLHLGFGLRRRASDGDQNQYEKWEGSARLSGHRSPIGLKGAWYGGTSIGSNWRVRENATPPVPISLMAFFEQQTEQFSVPV